MNMIPGAPVGVVLIDVDGTLVEGPKNGPSAGLRAMNEAACAMTGADGLGDQLEFAGRTDLQIAKLLLTDGGIENPAPQQIQELLHRYLEVLDGLIESSPYRAIGSVSQTIPEFGRKGYVTGLGTGNLKQGTLLKLKSSGLLNLFDLSLGGYAEDGEEREDILRAGIRRCDPSGSLPVVIIGDTPRDVVGAHRAGAKCIGIPHGNYNRRDLETAGADAVVDQMDLSLLSIIDTLIFDC